MAAWPCGARSRTALTRPGKVRRLCVPPSVAPRLAREEFDDDNANSEAISLTVGA